MMHWERLDVYVAAVEFRGLVEQLVPARGKRDVREQLEPAATNVVLNIAEGAGRHSAPEKARFYEIARGSATECVGALAVLRVTRTGPAALHEKAHELLERIVMMLHRLIARFSDRGASASP